MNTRTANEKTLAAVADLDSSKRHKIFRSVKKALESLEIDKQSNCLKLARTGSHTVPMFFLAILLLLCGCVVKPGGYTKILSPDEKIVNEGVSLLPPQGDGWYVKKKDLAHLEIGKKGGSKDQSIVGVVILSKLPEVKSEEEFLALVSKQRWREPNNPRYENIINEEKISKEKGSMCVRFHTKYKDYGAKNLPESSKFLIIEDIGIICQHPNNKMIAVNIVMSQRTVENNEFKDFNAIAEGFIAKAELIPFTKSQAEMGFDAYKVREYDKAIGNFNQAIADNPKDVTAVFFRGLCYFDQKKYPLALSDFERTISLKEDYLEAYANIGSIYLKKKDYEKALKYVNMAIKYADSLTSEEQIRREVPVAYAMRGEINHELKNYEQVIEDYRYLVKQGNKNWDIYINLAGVIIEHGSDIDRTECLNLLKNAETMVPKEYLPYVYDTYGELFLKLGEKDKAKEFFDKAFQQSSDQKFKDKVKEEIDKLRN